MKPDPAARVAPEQSEQAAPTASRRTGFRLLALGLPFLLLLAVEGALRLAGYGYPTHFFLKRQQENTTLLVENPKFGWRFFPPQIARAPLALRFSLQKPFGVLRIFVLGESAAMGDPEPAYGFGRQLQHLLQARHPNQHLEVINVAMTAINSHVIREIAADCAPLRRDAWVIYAGNNEVVGPFGAGTVFGAQAPTLWSVRAVLAAKTSRVGQFLASIAPGQNSPGQWQGMEFFVHNRVGASDRRLARVYNNFSANLETILDLGSKHGARMFLSTVAVNLKDCPPFASLHRPDLSPNALKTWDAQFAQGQQAQTEHRYAEALGRYQAAAQLDDGFAELVFRRAQCEQALGRADAAAADFAAARDLDALRFRTDSRLNEIIRQSARPGVTLVDAERALAREAGAGLSGDDQFYDHVHFNFSGNYRMARLLAEALEKELFPAGSSTGPWLAEAEVAHQLAFTEFDRRRIGEEMRLRLQQPPFSGQSNFQQRDQRWRDFLAASNAAPADLAWEYRAALALAPGDWVIRQNFGRLLEESGDRTGAAEQWSQVAEQLPDEPEAYFHLGNLAFDGGSYEQAVENFQRSLRLRPGAVESLNGLGLALAAQGRTNEAMTQFNAALRINPQFSAARIDRAMLWAKSGAAAQARAEYETVLQLDTNNVAARINLAKLLTTQGKTDEAITLYRQAVELRPENAVAQFDLGNALLTQGRHDEALAHYAAAVQHQPGFADAQYNLAIELARRGSINEALPHFAQAARLRPEEAEAHFNYGVALAKVRRYAEAAAEFEQTLKLQPNHPAARPMLLRAQQLASGPLLP